MGPGVRCWVSRILVWLIKVENITLWWVLFYSEGSIIAEWIGMILYKTIGNVRKGSPSYRTEELRESATSGILLEEIE